MDRELELLLLEKEKRRRSKRKSEELMEAAKAFGKGAVEQASLGFADELAGAIDVGLEYGGRALNALGLADKTPGQVSEELQAQGVEGGTGPIGVKETYITGRNEAREASKRVQESSPIAYGAGQLVGAAATPGGLSTSLAKNALRAGGLAAGISESSDPNQIQSFTDLGQDIASGIALDAAMLGGLKAVGKAGKLTVSKLKPGLKKLAEKLAVEATGATPGQVLKMDSRVGRTLLDKGIVKAGDSPASIQKKLEALLTQSRAAREGAVSELTKRGAKVDRAAIEKVLQAKMKQLQANAGDVRAAKQVGGILKDVGKTKKTIPLDLAEKTKMSFGQQIKDEWMNPSYKQAAKSAYGAYKEAGEKAAESISPELAATFKESKDLFKQLAPVRSAVENRVAQQQQASPVGLKKVLESAGGYAVGGPVGAVVAPTVVSQINKRGAATAAGALDLGAKILEKSPPKYAGVLKEAAAKGGKNLAITHFLVSQKDPEYQEAMKEEEE